MNRVWLVWEHDMDPTMDPGPVVACATEEIADREVERRPGSWHQPIDFISAVGNGTEKN